MGGIEPDSADLLVIPPEVPVEDAAGPGYDDILSDGSESSSSGSALSLNDAYVTSPPPAETDPEAPSILQSPDDMEFDYLTLGTSMPHADGGGGTWEEEAEGTITVTGKRPGSGGWSPTFYGGSGTGTVPSAGPGSESGGGSGSSTGDNEPIARETPCVEAAPADVALSELNNMVLAQSNELAKLNDEFYEYGVIFYLSDGVLMHTPIFTQNLQTIDWNDGIAHIPDGSTIVAVLHNHPNEASLDDRVPSGQDWVSYDSFMNPANLWTGHQG